MIVGEDRRRRAIWAVLTLAFCGCGALPQTRLAQCHQRSQALQAETAQLKDDALRLRARNRELADRAVEDARRMHTMAQDRSALEQSLVTYQRERDQLAAAFDRLQEQVRSAAGDSPPRAAIDRLETFAAAQPGCAYDAEQQVWSFPAESLFEPGSDTVKPQGELLLTAFARVLSAEPKPRSPGAIVARPGSSAIRQASAPGAADAPRSDLAERRARAVRDHLAQALRIDTAQMTAGFDSSANPARALSDSGGIEVRFTPPATAEAKPGP